MSGRRQAAPADLVLHVGLPFAGGDVLRRALALLRPQLREHGIAYIDHAELAGLPNLAGWRAVGDGHDPKLAARFGQDLGALVRGARAQCAAGERATVVISSEWLLGAAPLGIADESMLRPDAAAALGQVLAALEPRRARIVLYTRRQDRLLEHAYIRRVMGGHPQPPRTQFPFRLRPVLDLGDLVRRIAAVPGVADVVVKPFELRPDGVAAFVTDFLHSVGPAGLLDLSEVSALEPGRIYSAEAVRVSQAVVGHMDTHDERIRWRAFAVKTFGVPNDDEEQTRVFSDSVRLSILGAYRQLNRDFFGEYVPGVPRSTYDGVAPEPTAVRLGRSVRRAVGTARRAVGTARRRLLALRPGRR
jgi:hypothetical protein